MSGYMSMSDYMQHIASLNCEIYIATHRSLNSRGTCTQCPLIKHTWTQVAKVTYSHAGRFTKAPAAMFVSWSMYSPICPWEFFFTHSHTPTQFHLKRKILLSVHTYVTEKRLLKMPNARDLMPWLDNSILDTSAHVPATCDSSKVSSFSRKLQPLVESVVKEAGIKWEPQTQPHYALENMQERPCISYTYICKHICNMYVPSLYYNAFSIFLAPQSTIVCTKRSQLNVYAKFPNVCGCVDVRKRICIFKYIHIQYTVDFSSVYEWVLSHVDFSASDLSPSVHTYIYLFIPHQSIVARFHRSLSIERLLWKRATRCHNHAWGACLRTCTLTKLWECAHVANQYI